MSKLANQAERDLLERGFSRRSFGRIAAMLSAGAALPFFTEPGLAQLSEIQGPVPDDAVMINSNENPLGPCPEARKAAHDMVEKGGRYLFGLANDFQSTLAEQEGLKRSYVKAYAGSSAALAQAAIAFTSPERAFVTAAPGYESGENAARAMGHAVVSVPLTKTYAHDVRGMLQQAPNGGLYYICNPNNPSGTLTPREDIRWLVDNKPKGAIVMIDEAYTHISGAPFNSDLVAADKDVVILRTFSKIYGMAGLRAGAAMARPDLIKRIELFSNNMMPITGMAAAIASLKVKTLVAERRKQIGDVRDDLHAWLDKKNYKYVPSVSNCIMIDVGQRNTNQVINAMRADKVYVGRTWPAWPTKIRVTIGLPSEMDKFKTAFQKAMA